MKNVMGNLIGVTINLQIALGGVVILTVVILPIQEDGISLNHIQFSLLSILLAVGLS